VLRKHQGVVLHTTHYLYIYLPIHLERPPRRE
jgi:hypothetical protein